MDVELSDLSLFIYHVGVVISGASIVTLLGITSRLEVVLVSLVFALFWTAYYNHQDVAQTGDTTEP